MSISGGLFCRLKRESRAEIDLQEVVLGPVNDIPGGFGEYPNMGSKAILEPSTKVTQHPVTKAQASIRAYPIVPIEQTAHTSYPIWSEMNNLLHSTLYALTACSSASVQSLRISGRRQEFVSADRPKCQLNSQLTRTQTGRVSYGRGGFC